MTIGRLLLQEIRYRKLNFGLAVLSVAAAVGCLVAVATLFRLYDRRTEEIVAAKEAETREKMRRLEDDYRKITLKLGFNLLILPKSQSLADWYADDFAVQFMSEDYAQRLAQSGVATINHLLPCLQERVTWEERQRTIWIEGSRGEVPILNRSQKKPLRDAVPPGAMSVGHELHRSLGLARGDTVKLTLSRRVKNGDAIVVEKLSPAQFKVHKLLPPRGGREDFTVWINLAEAQKLLKREGQINSILALECTCEADRLDKIRSEVADILPDTQVIELASQALARAEARNRAAAAAREAVEREKENRAHMKERREEFAAVLVPLVLFGCIVWLGVLAFHNARARAGEIGILRALGLRSRQIMTLFLGKAVLVGLVGALLGYVAGVALGASFGENADQTSLSWLCAGNLFVMVLLAAPVVCVLATWLPAFQVARQDPAVVLQQG